MALTAGTITLVSVGQTNAVLTVTSASGSTAPYTNQWHRSTVSGFTPSPATAIPGATGLELDDSDLSPGALLYYKVVQTDALAATVTTAQQAAQLTAANVLNQNQFAQIEILGTVDLKLEGQIVSAQIDVSQSGTLVVGQAVKIVDSAGGVPKVIACTASTDKPCGYLVYNYKNKSFKAGDAAEMSLAAAMYMISTGAISRFAQVCSDVSVAGGVSALTTGNAIVGYAYDKATAAGQLIRVRHQLPSTTLAP